MCSRTLWFKLLLAFIQAVLFFNPHNVKADFSDSCVNSTTSTSCIQTYEQLYNSLAKSENSFNISSALYPAKRPSSVLLHVSVFGPTNSTKYPKLCAKYLWSISCLYAAIPATLLEVLSLGSILVAPRTQDLYIQIPHFCCNVSDKDNDRGTIIKGMIEGVLAELQDLAVSPAIRDPRLNTAECVIEGHKTDISATGCIRNFFISLILWSSVCFTFVSCHLLAYIFEHYRKLAEDTKSDKRKPQQSNNDARSGETRQTHEKQNSEKHKESRERKEKEKKMFAKAVCTLSSCLAVIGFSILLAALLISIVYCSKGELRPDFPCMIFLIFTESVLVFLWRKKQLSDKCCSVRFTICASVTSYLASWLLIGIMINPTWGLTVTLLLCFFLAAFTFARYQCLIASENKCQVKFSCVCFVLAVIFLVLVVVMAGQAYYGRETADDTLKTALLSVIGALLSWLSWKKHFLDLAGDSSNESNKAGNSSNDSYNQSANQPKKDIEMQSPSRQPLLAGNQSSSNLNG